MPRSSELLDPRMRPYAEATSAWRLEKPILLVVHSVVVIALGGLTLLGAAVLGDTSAATWFECSTLSVLGLWCLVSWRLASGGLFNAYGLFLLSTLAFNIGQAPLQTLGLNTRGLLAGRFNTHQLNTTLLFVSLCLVCLHSGALAVQSGRRRGRVGRSTLGGADAAKARGCRYVGLALLAVSAVPAVLTTQASVAVVNAGGYGALYGQTATIGVAAAPQVLAGFLVPGAIFLLAGSKGERKWVALSAAVIGVYLLAHLYLGDRATAVFPLIAWAFVFSNVVRRIRARTLVIGTLLAFVVVFPTVGQLRGLNAAARGDLGLSGAFASVQNPALNTLSETGGSMATVAATMQLVPTSRQFDQGSGYGYAALTAVPNLFWPIHPTSAQADYQSWLIRAFDPVSASLNIGMGFSYMAEAYANFGWVGSAVCLLIGAFMAAIGNWARRGDVTRYALLGTYLSTLLIWPRAEASYEVRPLLWYALAPYLIVLLLSSSTFRGAPRTKERTASMALRGMP